MSQAATNREKTEMLRDQLSSELTAARMGLDVCRKEVERLRGQLARFEEEHRRVCQDYAAVKERIAELGSHCVVMERLHGTLDHREVLAGIQDCVINIIGSEELAIYEPSEEGLLEPVQTFGVEGRHLGPVCMGAGPVGRAASEHAGWTIEDGPPPNEAPDLTACVPLETDDRLMGVLAIWRMLPHKPVFGDADRNVLELLARHAATALYLTSSEARARSGTR